MKKTTPQLARGVIYHSNDPDLLIQNRYNRHFNCKAQLNRVIKSIQNNGFLSECHILVNKDMIIVDGHYRYEAWKQANEHAIIKSNFSYMLTELDWKHFVMNIPTGTPWSPKDWLNCYVYDELPDYVIFNEFFSNASMKISTCISLCNASLAKGGRNSKLELAFKEGTYKANNIKFARQVWNHLQDFKPVCRGIFDQREFVFAVADIMRNPHYMKQRMISQLNLRGPTMETSTRKSSYLKSLQEIYNYGLHKNSQLRIVESSF